VVEEGKLIRKKGGSNEESGGLKEEREKNKRDRKMMKGGRRKGKRRQRGEEEDKPFILIPSSFMQFQKITMLLSIDFLLMSWGLKLTAVNVLF
jgi:hypothetical protein